MGSAMLCCPPALPSTNNQAREQREQKEGTGPSPGAAPDLPCQPLHAEHLLLQLAGVLQDRTAQEVL